MSKKYFSLFIFILLSVNVFSQAIRITRICKDFNSGEIEILYEVGDLCGNGNELILYGRENTIDDFKIIDRTATTTSDTFRFNGGTSADWEFYITLYNNCDSDSVQTVTREIDRTPPQGVELDSITVVGNRVVAGWRNSISNDFLANVIYYRDENRSNYVIDTVSEDDPYVIEIDSLDPRERTIGVDMAGFDLCEVSTGPTKAHRSVYFVLEEFDVCNNEIRFSRTNYVGWDGRETYHLIYREVGMTNWAPVRTNIGLGVTIPINSLSDGVYEFKIRAVDSTSMFSSSSNAIRVDLAGKSSVAYLYINGATVGSDGVLRLKWECSNEDYIEEYVIYSGIDSSRLKRFTEVPRVASNEYTLVIGDKVQNLYFKVEAISDCKSVVGTSNFGRSIILKSLIRIKPETNPRMYNEAISSERKFSWNGYHDFDNSWFYLIERKTTGIWEELGTSEDLNFTDNEALVGDLDSGICYRVTALDTLGQFRGESKSFQYCFTTAFHGAIQNTIIPSSEIEKNQTFKIIMNGVIEEESNMKIFNRWGQRVFESNLPISEGWNGNLNGDAAKPCATGVYYYTCRLRLESGELRYFHGFIYLIR